MNPRCFFCGEDLKPGVQPDKFRCAGCKALFRARVDPEGCVLALEVDECGADECCRHRKDK